MNQLVKNIKYIVLVLLFACNHATRPSAETAEYKRVFLMHYSIEGFGEEKVNYVHYISVENFSADFFEKINFSNVVKNYVDTCRYSSDSSESIFFLKSTEGCGFESNELDEESINENSIAGFQVSGKKIVGVYIFDGPYKKLFLLKGDELKQTF